MLTVLNAISSESALYSWNRVIYWPLLYLFFFFSLSAVDEFVWNIAQNKKAIFSRFKFPLLGINFVLRNSREITRLTLLRCPEKIKCKLRKTRQELLLNCTVFFFIRVTWCFYCVIDDLNFFVDQWGRLHYFLHLRTNVKPTNFGDTLVYFLLQS